jgi:hypothetical protein
MATSRATDWDAPRVASCPRLSVDWVQLLVMVQFRNSSPFSSRKPGSCGIVR